MSNRTRSIKTAFRLTYLTLLLVFIGGILNSSSIARDIPRGKAMMSLKDNRDRLLDSYATHIGQPDRVAVWNQLTTTQKGVFLTITDLLGRRTYMNKNYNHLPAVYTPTESDYDNGCVRLNYNFGSPLDPDYGTQRDIEAEGAYISHSTPEGGPIIVGCHLVSADVCVAQGHCSRESLPRTDHDMALNHVVKLYAIRGSWSGSCSGGNNSRLFFSVDNSLLNNFRNIDWSPPVGWRRSEDLLGPHSPFTVSRETSHGQPRGQIHLFAWDGDAVSMQRPGVEGVYDTNLAEMDIDYNWLHDSNPECSYGGVLGRFSYQSQWYVHGLYGSAEYGYQPS